MTKVTLVHVRTPKGEEPPYYAADDGVTILPNGVLMLVAERNTEGRVVEGTFYAPGQWHEVTITQEEM